jgi:hypothetical protein
MDRRKGVMKFTVQVVTLTDDGEESLRDVACVDRDDLTAASLGVSIAESKTILQGIQEVVVEWQMNAYLGSQRYCPDCGKLRHRKGSHHTVFRTVFGDLPVESPRCTHCPCQAHETESFSPLAELLPEHTTPELLYLETKWASLSSYGMSVKLLQDVLPFDEPLEPVTIRNHVFTLAERLEDELGDEQASFIDGCPRDWGELPTPDGPMTVGIDGGYVKAQGMEQGWFEVIAGKSMVSFRRGEDQTNSSIKCFSFVQTYDEKSKRRLYEHLQSQGLQMNQQIEFLSDGGDTVRDVQLYLSPEADHLLDWFHVTMRLTTMTQSAKGLPETMGEEEPVPLRDEVLRQLERTKWFLWHGNVFQALKVLTTIHLDLELASWERDGGKIGKLCKTVQEFHTFIDRNRVFIPNYGERYRNGERISTGFVESTVNQVVSKRMVKKQQMRWSHRGAHLLLQIRTRVLNNEWEDAFRRWYPGFRAQTQPVFA